MIGRHFVGFAGSFVLAFSAVMSSNMAALAVDQTYELTWQRTGWLDRRDSAAEVVTDSIGNVYVGGQTEDVYGMPDGATEGALVAKYNPDGTQLWMQLAYAASSVDHVSSIAIDSSSNVFIAGETYRYPGGAESFLVKYSSNGSVLWERHLGSPSSESGRDVAVDALGNVYVTGTTTGDVAPGGGSGYDAFLAKYSTSGALLWTKQMPDSISDWGYGVSIDLSGNIYVAGVSGFTSTLTKHDSAGNVIWNQNPNYSTPPNLITEIDAVATDVAGNVYTAGFANGVYDFTYGWLETDAVVAKHDANGNVLWQRLLATNAMEVISDLDVDAFGNVYVVGTTKGALDGANAGLDDAFWAKYDSMGNLLFKHQFGTPDLDFGTGVSVDLLGRVYISSTQMWHVNNYYIAENDAFISRFDLVPEPSTWHLLSVAGLALLDRRRGNRNTSQ